VKLDTLSAADQEFVKSWAANRVPRLRVTPKLVRSNRDDERYEGWFDEGRQTQVLSMSVEVENQDTRSPLSDAKLKYILVGRSVKNRNQYKILAVQSASLKLRAQESSNINFKTVKNSYDDAHYDKGGHKCVGYVLHIRRDSDDREVYSFGSTPILEKAIFNIVNLRTGDLTDENFIKAGPKKDGGSGDGIIVVE
ncbi:MAG: hypothetical protein HKO57_14825, partial [Akkermansiaceae bacterium]|nr:hypothetical protein [Akkermansiaceae bacterium]